jgi:putative tryptophan/tyrosine transport system substrate-binding protein
VTGVEWRVDGDGKKDMKKKITFLALCAMLFTLSSSAEGQQPKKVPRIGYLSLGSGFRVNDEAFRQGLRELGYAEGQNIVVEWRFVDGKAERYHDFAAKFVRLKVDAIVTASGDEPIIAAMNVTKTIPIIILTGTDPVARGFVASLARPGGNVTGLSYMLHELNGKRLDYSKKLFPSSFALRSWGTAIIKTTMCR